MAFASGRRCGYPTGSLIIFASVFTVILPDRRGHGNSGRPKGPESFGLRMVNDVYRILDHVGHETAHLVGFSQGSEVAWRAALECPDRIRSLFLISSGWPGPGLAKALEGYAAKLDWLPHAIADKENWLTSNPDLETFKAIVATMPEIIDVPEAAIANLAVPVFGVAGSDDPEKETIERLDGLLPDYTLEILPDTDHPGSSEHPKLPHMIDGFLQAKERRRSRIS